VEYYFYSFFGDVLFVSMPPVMPDNTLEEVVECQNENVRERERGREHSTSFKNV
jgi:hypothetical protein